MNLKGKFSIDCEKCGKSYDFSSDTIKFVESEDKKSDDTKCYVWEYKDDCKKCGNHIMITYCIFISKDGKVTDKKVEISGAKQTADTLSFD